MILKRKNIDKPIHEMKISKERKNKMIHKVKSGFIKILSIGMIASIFFMPSCDAREEIKLCYTVDLENDDKEGGAPISEKDGDTYVIPKGTMAIVEGGLKEGEEINTVKLLDEWGNYIEGEMQGKYLEECGEISQDDFEKYNTVYLVNASKDSDGTVNLESNKGVLKIKLKSINDGEYVLGMQQDEVESKMIPVIYINEEGIKRPGYINAENLIEIGDLSKEEEKHIEVTVNSNGVNLNVRINPDVKSEEIFEFEPGKEIKILKTDWENRIDNGNHSWVKVTLEDGREGYVASEYLKVKEAERESNINYNQDKVVGIDSVGLTGQQLGTLLETRTVSSNIGYETENKDVEFVMIKIGGYTYGTYEATAIPNNTIDQIAKCEELGVPYGYYFYSTCVDGQEAQGEFERIVEVNEQIKSELFSRGINNQKYNVFPLTIDVEISDLEASNDRQFRANDIVAVTKAKVELSKKVAEKFGRPMIYTAKRATVGVEKIFDIDMYNEMLGYDATIWYSAPYTGEKPGPRNSEGVESMPANTVKIIQSRLDTEIDGKLIDVDVMDSKTFNQVIGNQLDDEER